MTLRAARARGRGAPPEALDPLIQGVIDTGFELTGPIARGDWETVERHLDVIRAQRPGSRASTSRSPRRPRASPAATRTRCRREGLRTIAELQAALEPLRSGPIGSCRRWVRCTGHARSSTQRTPSATPS